MTDPGIEFSPDHNFDSTNSQEAIQFITVMSDGQTKMAIRESMQQLVGRITKNVSPIVGQLDVALDMCKLEHPHWFIEYKQPRTKQEKLKFRNRATKIHSRNKKIFGEVHKPFQQKLATVALRSVMQAKLVEGIATSQQEAAYLEELYNESDD